MGDAVMHALRGGRWGVLHACELVDIEEGHVRRLRMVWARLYARAPARCMRSRERLRLIPRWARAIVELGCDGREPNGDEHGQDATKEGSKMVVV